MNCQTIFFRSLLLVLISLTTIPVFGQNCAGYEKEMEEYFLNFQTGDQVNIRKIESVYVRCPQPTDKMSLIYHYFKALEVWTAPYLSDESAYHDARFYYEQAAPSFPYLLKAPPKDNFFVTVFFDRAIELETQLGIESIVVQSTSPVQRSRGMDGDPLQSEPGDWKKYTPQQKVTTGSTYRTDGNAATPNTLRKSEYRGGEYRTRSMDEVAQTTEKGEVYGNVGTLNELDALSYLRHQREWDAATLRSKDIAVGATSTYRTRGDIEGSGSPTPDRDYFYNGLTCIYDNLVVRRQPGETAQPVGMVRFGETVARLEGVSPVKQGQLSYISVRLMGGQLGWVPIDAIVPEGKLAAITRPTQGYLSLNFQNAERRNMILFRASELVVMEKVDNGYILVTTRNGEKRAWINGIGELSIDPLDVEIAGKIHDALKQNNLTARKAQLQRIRAIPGYEQSELAYVVKELLAESYSMN